MIIQGTFKNVNNQTITVRIENTSLGSGTRKIGENGLFFTGDPIHITTNNDDTFQTIIRKSCEINFATSAYVGDLFFAQNARSVTVEITKGSECLFYGFVDPGTFTQPYTNPLDEFSINCIDCLSTLQYYNYNNATIRNYDQLKASADNVTFYGILQGIFDSSIKKGVILFDKSKGLTSTTTQNVFENLGVAENIMFGEDFEDIWTQEQTLNEMLQYLNLHIIQEGKDYLIFDWDTIRNRRNTWINLDTKQAVAKAPTLVTITSAMHSDNGTNISISDVYNQIMVKDELEGQETIIENPLENSKLSSLFTGKQLYMTEFISEGSGDDAHDAMVAMVQGNPTTYDGAKEIDWYIQAMNNPNWKCLLDGQNIVETIVESDGNAYINQWKIAKYLKQNQCVPYIFRMGNVEHKASATDNTVVAKIQMSNYLYISINGNEIDAESTHSPSDDTIHAHSPMIEYLGQNGGGALSPTDDETTNYLVFTGKLLLQPVVWESSSAVARKVNTFEDIRLNGLTKSEGASAIVPSYSGDTPVSSNNLVKSDNNGEGRYYTRKFYTQAHPSDTPSTYLKDGTCGVQPWTEDKSARGYEFNYSATGDSTDRFSKLPILECELIIGNKRLIETNMDMYGNSTFEWVTIGQEPTINYGGTSYPITTFTLGVNPKIGDYIIGDEFDLQNTIDYTMNIDAEGTAIPITKADALSGAVIFRILGPVNTLWNDITRRHPSFWRHTSWSSNSHFILSHTENIIIKDFECKIYSNNAGFEVYNQNDLIYMSNETDNYINKKDDITFKYITQLSGAEAFEKGLESGVNLNAVVNMTNSLPLTTIYNATTNETAKAEEHYINQYYNEYSSPKIVMETGFHNSNNVNFLNTYHSNALGKNFHIMQMGMDVRFDNITLQLKQI